jgi:hypothetical protein
MDTFSLNYERAFWNFPVLVFWTILIVQLPDRWPMLILLLSLQVGVNLLATRLRNLSTGAYWAFLFTLSLGFCWICYLHFGERWLWLIELIPLGRIIWGILSGPAAIFVKEDRRWN